MSQQGPNNPGTVQEIASGTISWTNIGNVAASDDAKATCALTSGQTTKVIQARNLGFAVPATATIVGILVEVERSASASPGIKDTLVSLYISGFIGDEKEDVVTNWPTTDAYASYGSSSDAWNAGLTPAIVNDPLFGLVFAAGWVANATAAVDHIRMTVFYTEASNIVGARAMIQP